MAYQTFEIPDVNNLFANVTFFGRNDSTGRDYMQLHDTANTTYEIPIETFVKALHTYNRPCFEYVIRAYNNASATANDVQEAIDEGEDGQAIAAFAFTCGMYTRHLVETMDDFFEIVDDTDVADATLRLFEFHNGMSFYSFDANRNDIRW